jgi:PAS domain S-box-containing protein
LNPIDFRQAIRASGLATSLDCIGHSATLTNASDEFVFVNRAFTQRYGWSEEEILGMRPSLLMPRSFPDADLALLRRKIAEPGSMWVGKLLNRCKCGRVCEVELAAFQIGLLEGHAPNLHLGLSTDIGRITEAINELGAVLCRMAFGIKSPLSPIKCMDKHQQIANLQAHGYTTKEIAGFLRMGINTPHVIMHRARRKKV